MRMMPYRTVDNVIAGIVITFMDMTKIAAAEKRINELAEALRARVTSLESVLDLLPVGAFLLENSQTGEVRINRYGAQLLGEHNDNVRPQIVVGQVRIFKDGAQINGEDHPLQRAARGEPVRGLEAEMSLANGARIPILMSATPLTGADGKPNGALATFMNLQANGR